MKAHIKKASFPVHPDSMVGKILRIYDEIEEFLSVNSQSSCVMNCHACCNDYFFISIKEFYTIVHYCLNNMGKEYLERMIAEGKMQKQALEKIYPDEYARLNTTFSGSMMFSEKVYQKYFNDKNTIKKRLPFSCAFLNKNGKCDVYKVRPSICRLYGSTCSSPCENVGLPKNSDLIYFGYKKLMPLDTVNGMLSRPYPILDWLADSLPIMLLSSEKQLFPAWTQPQND